MAQYSINQSGIASLQELRRRLMESMSSILEDSDRLKKVYLD